MGFEVRTQEFVVLLEGTECRGIKYMRDDGTTNQDEVSIRRASSKH